MHPPIARGRRTACFAMLVAALLPAAWAFAQSDGRPVPPPAVQPAPQMAAQLAPSPAPAAAAALRYGRGSWRFVFMLRPAEGNQVAVHAAEIRGILRSVALPEFTALKWYVLEAASRGARSRAASGQSLATASLLTEPRGRAGNADLDFSPLHAPQAQPREVREVVGAWGRLFLGGMPVLQPGVPTPGAPLLDFAPWVAGALAAVAAPEFAVLSMPVAKTVQVSASAARSMVSGVVEGEARVSVAGVAWPLRVDGRVNIDAASGMPLFASLRITGRAPDGSAIDLSLLQQLSPLGDP